jgi:hypothetical protein
VEVSFGAIVVVTVSADGGTVLYSGKVGMNEVVETDRVLDVVAVDVVIGIDVDVDNILTLLRLVEMLMSTLKS